MILKLITLSYKPHDEANTKQTNSKHEANFEHTSCACILSTFASRFLHVCFLV